MRSGRWAPAGGHIGGRDERGCSDRSSERVEVELCGRWLEKGTSLNPEQDLVDG